MSEEPDIDLLKHGLKQIWEACGFEGDLKYNTTHLNILATHVKHLKMAQQQYLKNLGLPPEKQNAIGKLIFSFLKQQENTKHKPESTSEEDDT